MPNYTFSDQPRLVETLVTSANGTAILQKDHLLETTVSSDDGTLVEELRILTAGCTGKEDPFAPVDFSGVEKDARKQVALGMKRKIEQSACATMVILTGDQVYDEGVSVSNPEQAKEEIRRNISIPYRDVKVPFYLALGNHELNACGHGVEKRYALDKRRAYVAAVQGVSQDDPAKKLRMPSPYYAQVVKNTDGTILSFVLYVDTNLLPVDRDQQEWLLRMNTEFDRLDPDCRIPRVFVGHHALLESVDKRGTKGKEGPKYANPEAGNANQHQLVYETLWSKEFPVQNYAVLAAHIHDSSIQTFPNQTPGDIPMPLWQGAIGGGGSWSNKGNFQTFVRGLKFADCTFGYAELRMRASQAQYHVRFWDCASLSLKGEEVVQPTRKFDGTVDCAAKTVSIDQTYLDPILLKRANESLSFANQGLEHPSSNLMLHWSLLANHLDDITAAAKKLKEMGVSDEHNAMLVLLNLPEEDVLNQNFLDIIEPCLRQMLLPVYDDAQPPKAQFLGLKKYNSLYKALQAYHYVLTCKAESMVLTNETLRPSVTASFIASSPDAFLDEEGGGTFDRLIPTPSLQKEANDPVSVADLHELDDNTAFIETLIEDNPSNLIQRAITEACETHLTYLYDKKYYDVDYKRFSFELMPFLAQKHTDIARVLNADFLSQKGKLSDLMIAILSTEKVFGQDFSATVFFHVATQLVRIFKRETELPLSGNDLQMAKKLLKMWDKPYGSNGQKYEDGQHIIQHARDFLIEHFKQKMKAAKKSAPLLLHELFLKEGAKNLWNEENPAARKKLLSHVYKKDEVEAKQLLYNTWNAKPARTWGQYFSSWLTTPSQETSAQAAPGNERRSNKCCLLSLYPFKP